MNHAPLLIASVLLVFGLFGCGSAGSVPTDDTMTVGLGTVEGEGTATTRGTLTISNAPARGGRVLGAPFPETWTALELMVTRLELPVTGLDRDQGTLTVGGDLPRLDGKRASHWFDCGSNVTGPIADRARIRFTVAFRVAPETEETARVHYTSQAVAFPRYNAGNRVACTPKAAFEDFVYEELTGGLS